MKTPHLDRLFALACAASGLALAGCGGGGSDSSSTASPPATPASAPAPAPAPVPVPAPSPAPSSSTTPVVLSVCGLSGFADRALTRINQLRAAGADCGSAGKFAPTTPVTWNTLLTRAADAHSQDMAAQNYFAHNSLDGRTPGDRITAAGYTWRAWAENIAAGYATVDSVMDGWTASPGHCANLMSPAVSEIGLSCVPGTSSTTYNNYWTLDLAAPR